MNESFSTVSEPGYHCTNSDCAAVITRITAVTITYEGVQFPFCHHCAYNLTDQQIKLLCIGHPERAIKC